MRYYLGLCVAMWMVLVAGASAAQDMRWIQIEAQPSLLEAETRARIYAQEFPDTQAHSIGSGWYAITLGPLPEDQADLRMSQLRARAAIPSCRIASRGSATTTYLPSSGSSESLLSATTATPAPKRRREAWAACFLGAREEPNTFTRTVFEGGGTGKVWGEAPCKSARRAAMRRATCGGTYKKDLLSCALRTLIRHH